MSKIYNWDTKKVTEISLTPDLIKKYFSKQEYSLNDIEKIFKTSYSDFKSKALRIDYFSEIANLLWGVLVKQKLENNKIGDMVLMVSELNFYLQSNNLDMVDDILYEAQQYLENKEDN